MRRVAIAAGLLTIGFVPLLAGLAYRAASSPSAKTAVSGPSTGRYLGKRTGERIRMPSFELRDYHGRLIGSTALRGKVTLITFLDTGCKAQCTIVAPATGSGLRLSSPRARFPISEA